MSANKIFINVDEVIREKWHEGFERTKPVSEIVIHGTGGGGTYQYLLQGERKSQYVRGIGLFHYLIERDGYITEIIDPERWVYHSSSGKHDERTIGIELVNTDFQNRGHYTMHQYNALWYLMFFELFAKYKIDRIMSHNRTKQLYSGGTKQCPGSAFDWDMLESELKNKGYGFDHLGECFWNIKYNWG